MAYMQLPTRTSADTNSAADINQLQDNIDAILGSEASTGPARTLEEKVTGPTSSTNNAIALFDGTTGKKIKDGGYEIEDTPSNSTNKITTSQYLYKTVRREDSNWFQHTEISSYTTTNISNNVQHIIKISGDSNYRIQLGAGIWDIYGAAEVYLIPQSGSSVIAVHLGICSTTDSGGNSGHVWHIRRVVDTHYNVTLADKHCAGTGVVELINHEVSSTRYFWLYATPYFSGATPTLYVGAMRLYARKIRD